jgi:diaminopimelate epimerase
MHLPFAKYEGLGNDFVVIELDRVGGVPSAEQAMAICDRHLGIGADGVLLVATSAGRPSMKVINADGSVPEMCGNGIRCVALHLRRAGWILADRFEIDTDAGPHACHVRELAPIGTGMVEVAMRAAALAPDEVPVRAAGPVLDEPFELAGRTLRVSAVSMGNPHAVTFDDPGPQRDALASALQRHERFPQHVNVGFARVKGPQQLELAVFERGAGWTQACGTGACAAAVAAVETGRAQRNTPIEVRLPGGALTIALGEPGEPIAMTGPARHVFDGAIEL